MDIKDIRLSDIIFVSYEDYEAYETRKIELSVEELIEDWYGDCDFLGPNDCKVLFISIGGDCVYNHGSEKGDITIETMMEALVRETQYIPMQ